MHVHDAWQLLRSSPAMGFPVTGMRENGGGGRGEGLMRPTMAATRTNFEHGIVGVGQSVLDQRGIFLTHVPFLLSVHKR